MGQADVGNVTLQEMCPSLCEYFGNHTEHNLRKVCIEVQELHSAIYATLQSEEEKNIFKNIIASIVANSLTTF